MIVNEIKTIFDNGCHNAFTSIAWFKNRPYIAFRCGVEHADAEGRVIVLRGDLDGDYWLPVATIWGGADTRDPKIMVTDEGLFVYCFTRKREPEKGANAYSYASGYAFSADGYFWEPWVPVEKDWIYWRPERFPSGCYLAAYSTVDTGKVRLLRSDDGRSWSDVCVLVHDDVNFANETALAMEKDGRMWAIIRRDRGTGQPLYGSAMPPYTEWDLKELPMRLGGPYLWLVDGVRYISGRWYHPSGLVNTTVFRMDGDEPVRQYVLPSGGDTSYMGAVPVPGSNGKRWWLSYYSSHAYLVRGKVHRSAIYLADVTLD